MPRGHCNTLSLPHSLLYSRVMLGSSWFSRIDIGALCQNIRKTKQYKLSPAAFEKHSGRETARKWKNNVWNIFKGEKVPLSKTVLLRYHDLLYGSKGHDARPCHRDEFVRCTQCNMERRFCLRTEEECRIHHDALANHNWECYDMPFDKWTI